MKLNGILFGALIGAMSCTTTGQAEEKAASPNADKISMHEKMAEVHRQYAECLKSGKSDADCGDKAQASCPMHGQDGCPFMGGGMGMMHGQGMMKSRGPTAPVKK